MDQQNNNTPAREPARADLRAKLKNLLKGQADGRTAIRTSMLNYMTFLGVGTEEWIELQALDSRHPGNLLLHRGAVVSYARGIEEVTDRLCEVDDPASGIQPTGTYVIMNRIASGVEARGAPGKWVNFEDGTADRDIVTRRAFYVDCDPVRPRGVQGSKAEVEASVRLYRSVLDRLVTIIDERAVGIGFSGSGMQIHLAVAHLSNTTEVSGVIKAILVALDLIFTNPTAKIDTSVSDPKRITPAWGSWKRKGAAGHEDRPWRRTAFVAHDEVQRLSLGDLQRLLGELRKDIGVEKQAEVDKALGLKSALINSTAVKSSDNKKKSDTLDKCNEVPIREVATKLGIDTNKPTCPWCSATSGVDLLDGKGINVIKCLHATCGSKSAGPVTLVAKLVANTDSLRGDKAAVKEVIGWFGREFGIQDDWSSRRGASRPVSSGTEVGSGENATTSTNAATTEVPTASEGDQGIVEIRIGVDTHRVVAEAVEALALDVHTYARGQRLVSVETADDESRDGLQTPGGLRAAAIPTAVLRTVTLSRCAMWLQYSEKLQDYVQTRVPADIAMAVSQLGAWPGVRVLTGITETPVMRADGSILTDPGYDVVTGLLYRSAGVTVPIKQEPDRADALAARDELLEVVCDMPLDNKSRASWLALVLSYFARPMFSGPTPIVIADGNLKGTAKTLSIKAAARLATARGPASLQYIHANEEEVEKRITATLMGAYPFVLFDNVENGGDFGNSKIDALATGDWWSGRMLGTSNIVDVPNRTIWTVSGNNIVVVGDTLRRVIHIRFDTTDERPEDRQQFKHPDLLGWINAERPRLVAAALTVLRAWVVAGRPIRAITMGSFEGWVSVVGEAVAWVTDVDVTQSRRAFEERDGAGDASDVQPLYAAITNAFGSGWFEADGLLRDLHSEDQRVERELRWIARDQSDVPDPVHALRDLREAICTLAAVKGRGLPDKRIVGRLLSRLVGRPCGGRRLERQVDKHAKTSRWRLAHIEGSGAGSNGAAGSKRVQTETVEPAPSTRENTDDPQSAGSSGFKSDDQQELASKNVKNEETTEPDDIADHLNAIFDGQPILNPLEPASHPNSGNTRTECAGSTRQFEPAFEPAKNPQPVPRLSYDGLTTEQWNERADQLREELI